MTSVDARFAGGHLEVNVGDLIDEPVVHFVAPGYDVVLRPHEARALADALNQVSDEAESSRILKRASDVDEQLMERDI